MPSTDSPTKNSGAIAWMAGHTVAANLIMFACLIGGYFFLSTIKQEVFPEFEMETVTVNVPYPGASPEEVESGIILAIEEAVSSLDGVDEVKSTAGEGMGMVSIEALVGTDMNKLGQDVQSEVDRITTFPEDAEQPQVRVLTTKRRTISIVLSGAAAQASLHELAEQMRDRLLQDPDITQIDLAGVRPLEISVEIPQENLRRYHLTIDKVAQILKNASIDLPGGSIKTTGGEILIRVTEKRDYGREFSRLPIITLPDGSRITLEQIATVTDGYRDTDYYATYNGNPAVMLNVYSVGEQTPIQVSKTVRAHIEEMKPALPAGIELNVLSDRSEMFAQRIDLLLRNSAMGLSLVLLVLALFLEFRLAFWVMMGIPFSFMGSFFLMPLLGVSINMISLFAYLIALGIVVDDAIVVGENIYYHRQRGLAPLAAAIRGAKEMATPVSFSILTNIATFMPLYFIPGTDGKIFRVIPLVVCTVFIISLLESVFVLPAHLAHQKEKTRSGINALLHAGQQKFSTGFTGWVRTSYDPFLGFVLSYRYITMTISCAVLIITLAYAFSGRMGLEMFPKVESDYARASLTMPYGIALEKTEAIAAQVLAAARRTAEETGHQQDLVEGFFTEIAEDGSHKATITVYLADPDIRDAILSTAAFTERWRTLSGDLPGIKSLRFESDSGGPGSGQALTVELNHRNLEILQKASGKLAQGMLHYPIVKDVDDGFTPGKEQLDFTLRPQGKSLGFTAREISRQIRSSFYGAEVLRQQRGRNEVRVMVRLPEKERISLHNIDELFLFTPGGKEVPLREIAELTRGRAYTEINRRNGRRVVQVQADVTPRSRAGEVLTDLKETLLPQLVAEYPGLRYSFEGRQADMRENMASLKMGFAMSMMVVFSMLAIPFRNYIQPLIVMTAIPFGIIGAIYGHLLLGYSLSIMSMMGIIALSGVVVNDSLVLITRANELKNQGDGDPRHIIRAAAMQRFRPIVLTTLTTFGGLAPMIMENSRQARFLIPMAISLGFGVLFATLITLVLVPCLYLIIEDIRKLARPSR
ncbi:MAG: cobalt-zinc-cadmium resistance protein [Desulfobulbaceae bacterium DB1]|nr:MAG: cobalt-zinc-cadmium resistance protein [Desulfobulbaceae bacterium DB1]